MRAMRATIAVTAVLLLTTGCATSGRSVGQWWGDKDTTARVKTALAAARSPTLRFVDVDTVNGTVHLSGVVQSEDVRRQAEDVARSVSGAPHVVNNLTVRRAATSSRPAIEVTSGPRVQAAAAPPEPGPAPFPVMEPISRLERLEGRIGSGDEGPWAAFDRDGRRVATVYAVPVPEMRARGASLSDGARPIRRVSVLPHPEAPGRVVLIVLWHLAPGE